MSEMPQKMTGADRAAAGREQELRLVVETIPTPVWRARPDGHIEYVNKRALEYFGAPAAEILGWGRMEKVHPDDIDFKVKTWLENLRSGRLMTRSADFEERTANIDGSTYAESRYEPVTARCNVGTAS
jgi:PAS domain S-box-containing protein